MRLGCRNSCQATPQDLFARLTHKGLDAEVAGADAQGDVTHLAADRFFHILRVHQCARGVDSRFQPQIKHGS